MKIYVIVQKSFEYNDETYSQPEGGGGHPIQAFKNKSSAEKRLDKLNNGPDGKQNIGWRDDDKMVDRYELVELEVAAS